MFPGLQILGYRDPPPGLTGHPKNSLKGQVRHDYRLLGWSLFLKFWNLWRVNPPSAAATSLLYLYMILKNSKFQLNHIIFN